MTVFWTIGFRLPIFDSKTTRIVRFVKIAEYAGCSTRAVRFGDDDHRCETAVLACREGRQDVIVVAHWNGMHSFSR